MLVAVVVVRRSIRIISVCKQVSFVFMRNELYVWDQCYHTGGVVVVVVVVAVAVVRDSRML